MKALITPPLCPLKDARLSSWRGEADCAGARKTVFGLLAETGKKMVVGQTGTFRHQPDNSPSIPHPGGLLFSPPASCHHLGTESNDGRVYFSVSKKDREREREEDGSDLVRAGGFTGSQETWTLQMFNKSLSSSPAFLNFQAPETFKHRADNETSSLSAVDMKPFHPNYTLPLSPFNKRKTGN